MPTVRAFAREVTTVRCRSCCKCEDANASGSTDKQKWFSHNCNLHV